MGQYQASLLNTFLIRHVVEKKPNDRWRTFKSILRKKWYTPNIGTEERFKCKDGRISKNQWVALVNHWEGDKAKGRSSVNQRSRAKPRFPIKTFLIKEHWGKTQPFQPCLISSTPLTGHRRLCPRHRSKVGAVGLSPKRPEKEISPITPSRLLRSWNTRFVVGEKRKRVDLNKMKLFGWIDLWWKLAMNLKRFDELEFGSGDDGSASAMNAVGFGLE